MAGISAGKAIGCVALPRVIPRVKALFFSGFSTLAYFIALTYAMVRLLPEGHPYLDTRNIGKYGVRHVIAAALHDLKFAWKNIDQILVFFAVMAGSAGVMLFIVAIFMFAAFSPVYAMSYVTTNAPALDVAFMMLDKVFGIPGLFNSEVGTNFAKYGPFPNNFHIGMRGLFQFYSMGLFLLSVFVFLYYVVVVVSETALTGTPFGRRFDNFWVPLRIGLGLALLMPGFGGLNSAQYIVLYAAKYGSGLATNTWISYNFYAGDNPMGTTNSELVARPAMPDYSQLIKDLILIRGCMEMNMIGAFFTIPLSAPESFYGVTEYMVKGTTSQPLLDQPPGTWVRTPPRSPVGVALGIPFAITYDNLTTFNKAMTFYNGGDIRIVLGTHSSDLYENSEGFVYPHCGEIIIPVTSQNPESLYVAEGYMAAIVRILYGIGRSTATNPPDSNLYELGMGIASAKSFYQSSNSWKRYMQTTYSRDERCYFDSDADDIDEFPRGATALPQLGKCMDPVPPLYWASAIARYQEAFEWAALTGYDYLTGEITEDLDFSIGDVYYQSIGGTNPLLMNGDILRYGWGGAGLWYNKIAEVNGALMSAIGSAPYVVKYPDVMEKIKEQRLKNDSKVETSGCEVYNPNKSGETSVNMPDGRNAFSSESALALYTLCNEIHTNELIRPVKEDSGGNFVSYSRADKSPNFLVNIINSMFGANTFFNILENRTVNPMSMLVNLGKTLIDKAIFNFAAATGTSVIGGLNQMGPGSTDVGFAHLTQAASHLSHAFVIIGSMALTSGFILFYVLPLLPFMYFFFAVGTWVKSIFEAMVGVPLWALAHLSLKGPGLTGSTAIFGYGLILEIFIRPVLTVFALVSSFAVFSAMVVMLNTTFDLVLTNVFGADMKVVIDSANGTADPSLQKTLSNMRDVFDQFMFTLMYIILVYIIGTGCFKLIDQIPEGIMRWSGVGVKTWGGITLYGGGDNTSQLITQMPERLAGNARKMVGTLGEGITSFGDEAAQEAEKVIRGQAEKPPETAAGREIRKAREAAKAGTQPDEPRSAPRPEEPKQDAPIPEDPITRRVDPETPVDPNAPVDPKTGKPPVAGKDPLTGEARPKNDPITSRLDPTKGDPTKKDPTKK